MKRQELWDACDAASDRLSAAFADLKQDMTAATRMRTVAAIRKFIECLHPLVGGVATFQYQASWEAFEKAADRCDQLHGMMASRPRIDAADAELMNGLRRDLERATKAFQREQTAMKTLLDEVAARDAKGDA